jgi:peptidyl-tRNA hydrolase
MNKLIVVTRRDLPLAVQGTQALHAAMQFALDHPAQAEDWAEKSNTVVIVAVADEQELQALCVHALDLVLKIAEFHEPDLGGQLTALAIEPSALGERLAGKLPLAFSAD